MTLNVKGDVGKYNKSLLETFPSISKGHHFANSNMELNAALYLLLVYIGLYTIKQM